MLEHCLQNDSATIHSTSKTTANGIMDNESVQTRSKCRFIVLIESFYQTEFWFEIRASTHFDAGSMEIW